MAFALLGGLLAFAILLGLATTTVQGQEPNGPPAEEDPKRISIAYCSDCVPFHFTDKNGRPAGLIIDIWRLWSKRTGIAIDFRAATWDETLRMVGAGVADAHAGLFFNKERDKFLDYGSALTKTDTHVFLHKSLPPISNLQDLSAYRIGVLEADFVQGFLKDRLPVANIVGLPDYGAIITGLKKGTLRAFAADTPTGIFHLRKQRMLSEFTFPNSQRLYRNDWFVAAREGNRALLKIINRGMARIEHGERLEIVRRWASGQVKGDDVLIIAMDRAYAPLTFLNAGGNPAGLLVDMWRLWATKTGRKISFRASDWVGTLEALRAGEADIHAGLFRSDSRAKWMNFSKPYYEVPTSLYFAAGTGQPASLAALAGKRVGVVGGSFQKEFLTKFHSPIKARDYTSEEQNVHALLAEEIDAFVGEDLAVNVVLDRLGLRGGVDRSRSVLFRNELFAGSLIGKTGLRDLVDLGLSKISNKEMIAIEKRWIADPANRYFHPANRELKLTDKERKWLADHGQIRLGVDPAYPPFDFVDENGTYSGMASDYVRLIGKRLGVRMEVVPDLT